ncbi:MAG: hypothetical protein P4L50_06630 [Anaerolineaceae bacterium]|nr:hypothetical protein [Anaerolineaceae bacterium]
MKPPFSPKQFILDNWYKSFYYLGAVLILFWIVSEIRGTPIFPLQSFGFGFSILGFGEWRNHKHIIPIKSLGSDPGSADRAAQIIRMPDTLGIIFDCLGVILIVLGIVSLFLTR